MHPPSASTAAPAGEPGGPTPAAALAEADHVVDDVATLRAVLLPDRRTEA